MRFLQTTGKRGDNFFVSVQNDVDDELQSCCVCCIQHVLVNRVTLQYARAGVGRINEFAAMVCQDGVIRGDSGEHGLPATGKAGKQVGFNKTLCEQQVSLNCDSV